MADAPAIEYDSERRSDDSRLHLAGRTDRELSLKAAWKMLAARRWLVVSVISCAMLGCLLYCLLAAPQYKARARLALRTTPATTLHLDHPDNSFSGSLASGQTQLETLASVFRSDELAWQVILDRKLYRAAAFNGRLSQRFPRFLPDQPSPESEAYLLSRFQDRLHVRTIPRTLILEIDFSSGDAVLSADVVNQLIRAYEAQEAKARVQATGQAASWLQEQLRDLRAKADHDDERLAAFQKQNGVLVVSASLANGQSGTAQHVSAFLEIDELARALSAASADRILREAEYRAASQGDPELVLASDARSPGEGGDLSIAVFHQIHARRGELEEEAAKLDLDHGPNFPRVVEIREQLQNLDRQLSEAGDKLRGRYKQSWRTAVDREQMLRRDLGYRTAEGMKANAAALQYETMRSEADASRGLYLRLQGSAQEAGIAAGVPNPDFRIVDSARSPARPSSPNLVLYLAVTLFVSSWLAACVVFALEGLQRRPIVRAIPILLLAGAAGLALHAQAPIPSTSGLPTGVARIPQSRDARPAPAPANGSVPGSVLPAPPLSAAYAGGSIPAPIAPGDLLDVSEFHTPEFHSIVRVTASGTLRLPMVGEVAVLGMDEPQAAHAISTALAEKGMLRHPEVAVLILSSVGQDVSILGEVMIPGMYPFGVHHSLLDLIAAAAGTTPAAGTLAYVYHRDDPGTPHVVALDRGGSRANPLRNPDLKPGDTVQMSRAGLVYVVGDVARPGGFSLEPGQPMTVLEAVSLAWGPTQNAALNKTLLIREHPGGGRTVTSLNLKRMLRGQEPDVPIGEHDILFIPDSTLKNLWNRTMESVVQSTAGVGIYSGLVYSQRF